MPPSTRLLLVTALAVCLAIARAAHAAERQEPVPAPTAEAAGAAEKPVIDMEHAETFIDVSEAIRSRQYVQRTILSTVIRATTKFSMDRFYVNHLMGFSSVIQASGKSSSGLQGLATGYVSSGGHGFEVGAEFSAVSNVYAGYRYIYRPDNFSLWPILGFGAGMEVNALNISKPPRFNPDNPVIPKSLFYGMAGLLIPLVDVGLRAEVRFSVQGMRRLILTQGLGLIVFL